MRGLQGKRIVIAGGATGIGAATAERLAEEGAAVVVGDLNIDGARATAKRVTEAGGTALAVEFDLADERSVQALISRAVSELGAIDGLYNVGAELSPETMGRDTDLLGMDPAIWRRNHDVNLLGYALTCREAIPHLLDQGGGVIVNTSSGAAWGGDPSRPAYSASKAGVSSLTRHIAGRWGKEGIRCNGVAPGVVMTDAFKQSDSADVKAWALRSIRAPRLGEPEDLAGVVSFLFSDDAAYVSGQVWSVCGGWSLRE
ncbi:SDR family NAD(P)-dependent oxidoreductase [Streptomyces hawaiiensis]|uniref:SDR family NAD(P)-dependent oxidoreductase n=1 Tax=Streptomyces hawaiiensis TaxID=67305 RepID=UPI003665C35D